MESDDFKKFNARARSKQKENKAFLKKLKALPPKQLDQKFHKAHQNAFAHINCLDCANCCKTTGPLFTENDINRIARHFRMKPSEFINTYLRVDEDKDFVLQTVPCPFLGDDNYCGIYEVRPKACKEYPHTDRNRMHQVLELTRKNIEVCPAVFEMVEDLKQALKEN